MRLKVLLVAACLALSFTVASRAQEKEKAAAEKGGAVAVISVPGMT